MTRSARIALWLRGAAKRIAWATTFLTVLVGVVAALYLGPISEGGLGIARHWNQIAWATTAFWCLVFITGITSFLAAKFSPSADEVASLQRDVRFQQRLALVAPAIEALVRETANAIDVYKKQPEVCVRLCLRALCELAWLFDGQPDNRYAANVMVFVPEKDRATAAPLKFHDGRDLEGVLSLRRRFSATRAWRARTDDRLEEFSLAIPRERQRNGKECRLPGAPRAFDEATDFYEDAVEMIAWCEASDLAPSVRDELRTYLDGPSGVDVRSFVSFALASPTGEAPPLGVVNVHRDEAGLAAEYPKPFFYLARPLLGYLEWWLARALKPELAPRGAVDHDDGNGDE